MELEISDFKWLQRYAFRTWAKPERWHCGASVEVGQTWKIQVQVPFQQPSFLGGLGYEGVGLPLTLTTLPPSFSFINDYDLEILNTELGL